MIQEKMAAKKKAQAEAAEAAAATEGNDAA